MSETSQLGLPMLQPAQAQKHVTVNEALAKIDGLAQLVLSSATQATPPVSAADGTAFFVPAGGVNEWAGQDGNIAIYSNGGWVFSAPKRGWRAFILDESASAVFDGATWNISPMGISLNGASSSFHVYEFDHVITAGSSTTTTVQLPQYAMVHAVTGRVKSAITGTLSAFDIGVSGATNRYGSGIGLAAGSWFRGITGQPVTYYADTPLEITAVGGDFASGELRLVLHYYLATVPSVNGCGR